MAKIVAASSIISLVSGPILDTDRKGLVVYGGQHEGVKLQIFASPEEAEIVGVRLIQLAVIARNEAAAVAATAKEAGIIR